MKTAYYAEMYRTECFFDGTSYGLAISRCDNDDDPTCSEKFGNADSASAWPNDVIADEMASTGIEDGYIINRSDDGDTVTCLIGSVYPVTLNEDGDECDTLDPVFEATSLPLPRRSGPAQRHEPLRHRKAHRARAGGGMGHRPRRRTALPPRRLRGRRRGATVRIRGDWHRGRYVWRGHLPCDPLRVAPRASGGGFPIVAHS